MCNCLFINIVDYPKMNFLKLLVLGFIINIELILKIISKMYKSQLMIDKCIKWNCLLFSFHKNGNNTVIIRYKLSLVLHFKATPSMRIHRLKFMTFIVSRNNLLSFIKNIFYVYYCWQSCFLKKLPVKEYIVYFTSF